MWVAFFLIVLVVCKLHVRSARSSRDTLARLCARPHHPPPFFWQVRKVPAMIMFGIYFLYIVYQFTAAFAPEITLCFSSVNICI